MSDVSVLEVDDLVGVLDHRTRVRGEEVLHGGLSAQLELARRRSRRHSPSPSVIAPATCGWGDLGVSSLAIGDISPRLGRLAQICKQNMNENPSATRTHVHAEQLNHLEVQLALTARPSGEYFLGYASI